MTTSEKPFVGTLLLVGASRGLGYAIVENYLQRGWNAVGTVRGEKTRLHGLREQWPSRLHVETLDVTNPEEIAALRERLRGRRFDVLFHNAGIEHDANETAADVSTLDFERVMVTNALSPLRVIEALCENVVPGGTIAVMSSGQGSVANNEKGGHEIYRASKAALNMLVRSFAARHAGDGRSLLLLAPGWVRTDLGGPNAPLRIEDTIPKLVGVIEAHRGRFGLHYLDYRGETIPW